MWLTRLCGILAAAMGAIVLATVWAVLHDGSGPLAPLDRIGMPGVLLIAVFAIAVLLFGAHLAVQPQRAFDRFVLRRGRHTNLR